MAIKKSELYRSLWSSCDELRGGMDASQYKDYVLTLLFVKYVSDKYAGKHWAWRKLAYLSRRTNDQSGELNALIELAELPGSSYQNVRRAVRRALDVFKSYGRLYGASRDTDEKREQKKIFTSSL